MNTKGKFYIWLNGASTGNYYWMQHAQNWTSNAHNASMFDSRDAAQAEARHALEYSDQHGMGEVHVFQATRDLAAA